MQPEPSGQGSQSPPQSTPVSNPLKTSSVQVASTQVFKSLSQSPLAQSQSLTEVQTAVQWFSLVQSMGPEAFLLGVNVEGAAEWLGQKMGVATELMRTKEQRSQIQKQIGALAAQQQGGGGAIPANDEGGTLAAAA